MDKFFIKETKMFYEFISRFHLWSAIFALVFGLAVFFVRKGTRLHKQLGYAYFFNMLGLNISALFIYQLTGNFGPFHISALASLLTLIAGFVPAYLRLPRKGWLDLHYEFMNWSYVGLVAAGVSEVVTRIPSSPFWPAVTPSAFPSKPIGMTCANALASCDITLNFSLTKSCAVVGAALLPSDFALITVCPFQPENVMSPTAPPTLPNIFFVNFPI
jgi:uncharacterized membrane protein